MKPDKLIKRIKNELIGAQEQKRALIVEGPSDKSAYPHFLHKLWPDWETRWVLAEAGSKKNVLEILAQRPSWQGIVDRDEWDDTTTQPANLFVLPRYCLESYMIEPAALWQALPPQQQNKIEGGQAALTAALIDDIDQDVRHCVLWKVVSPLWTGLRALGFKEDLASANSFENAQDDQEIERILNLWDAHLNAQSIFESFTMRLQQARSATLDEQLAMWVHGKVFWEKKVNAVLTQHLGQMNQDKRKQGIVKRIPAPQDFAPLIARLQQ